MREHRDGILASIRLRLSHGRVEGLNNKIRLITRRAFGFRSAKSRRCHGPIVLWTRHSPTST
ncbi:MAG: transposase [Pseudonocardiaceae bacterium]